MILDDIVSRTADPEQFQLANGLTRRGFLQAGAAAGGGLMLRLFAQADAAEADSFERVQQSNFDSYQMLRMNEAPAIEVHIVQSSEPPGGMGECGTSLIVPAVANAIFTATGKRLRKMPVDAAALKQPT